MKRLITILIAATVSMTAMAQAPEGVNYQALARDGSGDPMTNESISVRMTIKESGPAGTTVYQETHSTSTNDFGRFSLVVGQGSVVSGTFSNIDWGSNSHFIQVEVDPGSGYVNLGTTQLVSVPYALYAKEAGNAGTFYNAGTGIDISGNTISNTGDTDPIDDITNTSNAGGDVSGTFNNLTVEGLQGRTVSGAAPSSGEVLKWNGSSWASANDVGGGAGDDWGSQVVQSDATLTGDGTSGNDLGLAQQGASSGEVLKWNGSQWAPASDNTGGGSSPWQTTSSDIYYNSGEVGVGTSSPAANLHLALTGTSIQDGFRISSSQGTMADWYLYMPSSDNLVIRDDAQDVLTLEDGTGRVGLGTSNPSNSLSVDGYADISDRLGIGLTNPSEALEVNGNIYASGGDLITSANNGVINAGGGMMDPDMNVISDGTINNDLVNGDEDLYIYDDLEVDDDYRFEGDGSLLGKVGIGTTGAQADEELHIMQSGIGEASAAIQMENSTGNYWRVGTNATVHDFDFAYNGSTLSYIEETDGSYNTLSDIRLKESITEPGPVLAKVMKLEPKEYFFKADDEKRSKTYGFIAQDVQRVFPGFVNERPNGILTMAYDNFAVLSIQAIQEQQWEIDELNQQIRALEVENERLRQLEEKYHDLEQRLSALESQ